MKRFEQLPLIRFIHGLTAWQERIFTQRFEFLDTNNSGKVELDDFLLAANEAGKALKLDQNSPILAKLKKGLENKWNITRNSVKAENDYSTSIVLDEYLSYCARLQTDDALYNKTVNAYVTDIIEAIDQNGDGVLSFEEYRTYQKLFDSSAQDGDVRYQFSQLGAVGDRLTRDALVRSSERIWRPKNESDYLSLFVPVSNLCQAQLRIEDNHILVATYKGKETRQNLASFIGNNDGNLEYGGENFQLSSFNIRIEGTFLLCDARQRNGVNKATSIDLGARFAIDFDGNLTNTNNPAVFNAQICVIYHNESGIHRENFFTLEDAKAGFEKVGNYAKVLWDGDRMVDFYAAASYGQWEKQFGCPFPQKITNSKNFAVIYHNETGLHTEFFTREEDARDRFASVGNYAKILYHDDKILDFYAEKSLGTWLPLGFGVPEYPIIQILPPPEPPVIDIDPTILQFLDNGKKFFIKSALGNVYLHVPGAQATNANQLTVWEYVNQDNLKWTLSTADGGYYINTVVNQNFVVHLNGIGQANGDAVSLWDKRTHGNQDNLKVKIEKTDDGFYLIKFNHSGKYVHVHGGGTANNTPCSQWEYVNQANLKWELVAEDNAKPKIPLDPLVAQFLDNGKKFFIKSAVGNVYMHVPGSQATNANSLTTWEYVNQDNLKWTLSSADGGFYINTVVDQNFVVHLNGIGQANGDVISLWDKRTHGNQANLKVKIEKTDDGFFLIRFNHSGKYAHVNGGGTANNTPISQWEFVNQANLKWSIIAEDNAKPVLPPLDPLVAQFLDNGKQFYIKSAVGNVYMHVPGAQAVNGNKLTTWEYVNQANLKWTLSSTLVGSQPGYYINSVVDQNFVVHLHGGGNGNADPVSLWDKRTHGTQENMKVRIEKTNDGYFLIRFNNSGKYAHVNGGGTANNTPISQWEFVNQANLKWGFIPVEQVVQPVVKPGVIYSIRSKLNQQAIDVGGASQDNEAKVIQYPFHGNANQQWTFEAQNDRTFIIKSVNSGKVLDVFQSSSTQGTKLQQYQQHGGDNQRWFLKKNEDDGSFQIQSKVNNLVIDIPGSSNNALEVLILWGSHNGPNQRWFIQEITNAFNETTPSPTLYISCWARFDNFNRNYPQIATSASNAFQLHGLGPAYGGNKGRVAFYLQTPGNVGPHGRGISGIQGGEGQGWVGTSQILTPGQWYFLEIEKGSNYIKFGCNGEVRQSGLSNGVTVQNFVMKPTGNILVKKGTGDLTMDGEVRDFRICPIPPPNAFQIVVPVKNGDRFNYWHWGGECVVEWHGNDIWIRRTDANFNGSRCWKTQNGDGIKLIQLGQTVKILWDNVDLHEARFTNANTITVKLGNTDGFVFTRM